MSDTSYVAWMTTSGVVRYGSGNTWPRSVLVAFDARSGDLIKSFGKGGILTYGGRFKEYSKAGTSDAFDAQTTSDGSILTCGDHMALGSIAPLGERRAYVRPFVVRASLGSTTQGAFLASGSATFDFTPTTELRAKTCRRVTETPSGRVLIAGYQSSDVLVRSRVLWIAAFRPDGTLDQSFGSGGEITVPITIDSKRVDGLTLTAMRTDEEGRIYLAGSAPYSSHQGFVVRLMSSGQLDASFGQSGLKWISMFGGLDISVLEDRRILVSGKSRTGHPAAGWLSPEGRWDPNFYGTGRHVYTEAESESFYPLSSGMRARMWAWDTPPRKQCGCTGASIATIENQPTLDSSILSAKRTSGGKIQIAGVASSPVGLSRVEIAVRRSGSTTLAWKTVSGTFNWSTTVNAPSHGKSVRIYSRAVDSAGAIEAGFGTRDRNKISLK